MHRQPPDLGRRGHKPQTTHNAARESLSIPTTKMSVLSLVPRRRVCRNLALMVVAGAVIFVLATRIGVLLGGDLQRSVPRSPRAAVNSYHQRWDSGRVGARIAPQEIPVTETNEIISKHLKICDSPYATLEHVMTNDTHPYHQVVSSTYRALRTFIPRRFSPEFSNPCWFGKMPGLAGSLHRELTEYRGCMPNVMEKYTEKEAFEIVQTALKTPAYGLKKQLVLQQEFTFPNVSAKKVVPPQCQGLKTYAEVMNSTYGSMNASRYLEECRSKYKLFCLPKIMLAGFPKGATSTMYYMMIKHPMIARSRMKEEHFWRDTFIAKKLPYKQLQVLYYIFHFERSSHEISDNPTHITGDGSTTTIFPGLYLEIERDEDMCIFPRLLVNLTPSMRIILMMRNPADRVYSDYWYLCAKFYWKEGRNMNIPEDYMINGTAIFHQMTLDMISNFKQCVEERSEFECLRQASVGYAPEVACRGPRIGLSLYYYHIVRWMGLLPHNQFLFLRTEDFLRDPHSTMMEVYNFLGLTTPTDTVTRLMYKNVNTWIKSSENSGSFKMPDETRRVLDDFFDPYNKLLVELLGDSRFDWHDIKEEED